MADKFRFELMQKCKGCPKQFEVMFMCMSLICPDYKDLRFYCSDCSKTKHDHRSIFIVNVAEEYQKKWIAFRDMLLKVFQSAESRYAKQASLIAYLEKLMLKSEVRMLQPVKWMSKDFDRLSSLHQDGFKLINEKVKIML